MHNVIGIPILWTTVSRVGPLKVFPFAGVISGRLLLPRDEWRLYLTAARAVTPGDTLKARRRRMVFVGRCCRRYPLSGEWFRWLETPSMKPLALSNPILYRKILRPYLTARLTDREKERLMRDHYRLLSLRLDAERFAAAVGPWGLDVLEFTGRNGEAYRIRMTTEARFSKEGEQTLVLLDEQSGVSVANMTFMMRSGPGGPTCVIGGIQGMPAECRKDLVKDVAKSLHGLRPKALLLFLMQAMAAEWGLGGLTAVSNQLHVSRHRDYLLNRSRRPRLTYDAFWEEMGGARMPDAFYELPLRFSRKPLEEIKPNKRTQYRQRYEMMARLEDQFRLRLRSGAEVSMCANVVAEAAGG